MYARYLPPSSASEVILTTIWKHPLGYRLLRGVRPFLPSRILLSLPDVRRTDVLNVIARHIKAKSYLEIGVSSGENFLRINVSTKCGVDPLEPALAVQAALSTTVQYFQTTSEEFFKEVERRSTQFRFDLVFIDGLHIYEQAIHDLQNCLRYLSPSGVVVMHDCNPASEAEAFRAESYVQAKKASPLGWNGNWCGDVWKAFAQLRLENPGAPAAVLDCDFGLGVLFPGRGPLTISGVRDDFVKLPFSTLQLNRRELLNLVPPVKLLSLMKP